MRRLLGAGCCTDDRVVLQLLIQTVNIDEHFIRIDILNNLASTYLRYDILTDDGRSTYSLVIDELIVALLTVKSSLL